MKEDFFEDIKKEILEIKDRQPHLSDDNAFIVWFMRAFITEDESQAIESLTGGSGDKSSDAIFIDHDNRLVFILQGKYHLDSSVNENRSDVIALADLGRSLVIEHPEAFKAILNKSNPVTQKKLEEIKNVIHKRNYQLILRYVSTGKISETNIKEGESRLDEYENARFETYSYKDLMKLMQDYIEGAAPPIPTINFPVQGSEVFSRADKSTGITSWIFTMNGTDVGNLFQETGIRLFARNIRGYLGNTEINNVMKNTIEKEPEYFWYYNNGITVICDEAKQIRKGTSNNIKVTNAQIINGQQTTRTLALVGKNNAEVLVKLIEIPRFAENHKDQYKHLVSEIVSATNWQNAISQSDLKSNDAEQVRIEKEFKKLNYFYIRKRMNKVEAIRYGANKYAFKVNKEELARALAACSVDPYEVRLGKDRLFEDDIYDKIFNGRKAAEYINIYWLFRKVSYLSKGDNKKVYSKWHVLNFVWSLLSDDLKKVTYRDYFRIMMEREKRYANQLQPLNKLINESFLMVLSYYRENKKTDGKVQEAIDFFKHVNLHNQIQTYYKNTPKYKEKLTHYLQQLFENIENSKE